MSKKNTRPVKEAREAAARKILEKAAEGFDSVAYGGAIERLVWEIFSPGCERSQKNADALIRLLQGLAEALQVTTKADMASILNAVQFEVYAHSEQGTETAAQYVYGLDPYISREVRS